MHNFNYFQWSTLMLCLDGDGGGEGKKGKAKEVDFEPKRRVFGIFLFNKDLVYLRHESERKFFPSPLLLFSQLIKSLKWIVQSFSSFCYNLQKILSIIRLYQYFTMAYWHGPIYFFIYSCTLVLDFYCNDTTFIYGLILLKIME